MRKAYLPSYSLSTVTECYSLNSGARECFALVNLLAERKILNITTTATTIYCTAYSATSPGAFQNERRQLVTILSRKSESKTISERRMS